MSLKLKLPKINLNAAFNPVSKVISLDTETTGLDHWQKDEPFMVTACDENGNTWACSWEIDPFTRKVSPRDEDLHFLSRFTEDPECEIEFFNFGFDTKMLRKMGVQFKCKVQDAGIRARVFNNLEFSFRLKFLSKLYLGIKDEDEKDVEDEGIPSVPTEKDSLTDESEKEFKPLTPADLSEEELTQLHKTTLKAILLSMQEFVKDKAADSEDEQVDPELSDQIDADITALDDEDLSADRLSEIEARWDPMISYFLDSSYHTPADELPEQDLEDQLPPENPDETESVNNVDAGASAPPMAAAPAAPIAPSGVAQPNPVM